MILEPARFGSISAKELSSIVTYWVWDTVAAFLTWTIEASPAARSGFESIYVAAVLRYRCSPAMPGRKVKAWQFLLSLSSSHDGGVVRYGHQSGRKRETSLCPHKWLSLTWPKRPRRDWKKSTLLPYQEVYYCPKTLMRSKGRLKSRRLKSICFLINP